MKRSQINRAIREAQAAFAAVKWVLPPNPKWDVCDFGLGQFDRYGLTLVNLAEEKEYCEKIMHAKKNRVTLCHAHKRKKEDIIVRAGVLAIQLWDDETMAKDVNRRLKVNRNGEPVEIYSGQVLEIPAGERVTMTPGLYHAFWPLTEDCVIGEVSTANDDVNDNFFTDPNVGRFPTIEEDEPRTYRLVSEKQ